MEIERIVKNLCSNASYSGGTVKSKEVDSFLEKHSTLYFCYGRAFELNFIKITDKTIKITRKWL